jgi:hypothetical protein
MFLDETGCILNEKMMPDVAITVPELEIVKNRSKPNMSMDKLEIVKNMSEINSSMEKCGGTRNFQTLRPQILEFLLIVSETFGGKPPPGNFFKDVTPVYY